MSGDFPALRWKPAEVNQEKLRWVLANFCQVGLLRIEQNFCLIAQRLQCTCTLFGFWFIPVNEEDISHSGVLGGRGGPPHTSLPHTRPPHTFQPMAFLSNWRRPRTSSSTSKNAMPAKTALIERCGNPGTSEARSP